jgi:hypothetical protein
MTKSPNLGFSGSFKLLLPFALLLRPTVAAVADFSLYPTGAQSCLNSAATSSKCDQSSVAVFNSCVCGNGGGFIDSAAACIGSSDAADLTPVYTVLSRNCADSNTPVNYSLANFLAKGSATTAAPKATTTTVQSVVVVTQSGIVKTSTQISTMVTSIAPAPIVSTITLATTNAAGQATGIVTVLTFAPIQSAVSSSSTSSSSTSSPNSSKGLSTGAVIGIGVGVGIPIALALFGLIGILIWRGKKKDKANKHTSNGDMGAAAPSSGLQSSAATLQSDSPYAQPASMGGIMQYKQNPYQQPMAYDQNATQYSQHNSQYGYGGARPVSDISSGYGGMSPAGNGNPVELHSTPINRPGPQELPGDYRR